MDELKALWKGVKIKASLSRFALTFRAAVFCVSSDVPATRKICGFKGHSAQLECSRCLKKFLGGFGEKRDYSGFNRSSWKPRTNEEHRRMAIKITQCKTKARKNFLGQQSGITHYSILLRIDYFDMLLDFARLILCTISSSELPKECSNYGQTQNVFRPAN